MGEFAAGLGGYGAYVWPAYGIAGAVLGGLGLWSWRGLRRRAAALALLQGAGGSRGRERKERK